MTIRRAFERLLALFTRDRLERELGDEVTAHLELAERDALARGLSPADARQEALRQFGGIDQMKEVHRDERSTRWIENLVKDVRYGLASLRRDPTFTLIAVSVLALGIGANAAVFSIVDAVLLKPLPFANPERIVRMFEAPTSTSSNSTTARNFLEIKRRLRTFEAFSAESEISATVDISGEPTRLQGRVVSADHFAVFGIQPAMGRLFRSEEDQPGANTVIILSHAAWVQRFGSDPGILNRELRLDGVPHRVIGILPEGAFDRDSRRPRTAPTSFWKPIGLTAAQIEVGSHWLNPVGRLREGVTLAEAQQDMLAARAAIADLIPEWKKAWGVSIEPFDALLVNDRLRQSLYLALGAVALVLLITCASLTNLLLAKGAARQKEMAVRVALGAGRGRLIAQLLTESLVLGLLGGLAGVGLAALLIQATIPVLPLAVPFTADITLNVRVLAFAAAVALIVSAVVGLLPAMRMSGGSPSAVLNSVARGSSGSHDAIRRLIVGAEVAVSLVLICGSILLFKSLTRLQQVDIGAQSTNVVTASIDISREAYPTHELATGFYERLVDEMRAIPGVQSAAMSGDMPLEGTGGENLQVPGRDERLLVRFKRAGTGYFEALRIPLMAGRTFATADRNGSGYVVVINEALAADLARTFGLTDPIGRTVDLPAIGYGWATRRAPMTIIGIVGNERVQSDLRAAVEGIAYVPLAQAPMTWTKLAVRTEGDPKAAVPSMREALRRVDPHVALADVRTLDELRAMSLSGLKEPAWLIGIFAALSALLAALGLYGVVSHGVSRQRREIGIRMALGAQSGDVVSLVVRNVLAMIGAGVLVGLAGALVMTRVTSSLLFEVSALDPIAFVTAAAAMAVVGLVAALVPAGRATRVDPTTALRSE